MRDHFPSVETGNYNKREAITKSGREDKKQELCINWWEYKL